MKLFQDEHGIIMAAKGSTDVALGPTPEQRQAKIDEENRAWLANLIRVLRKNPDLAKQFRLALAAGDP